MTITLTSTTMTKRRMITVMQSPEDMTKPKARKSMDTVMAKKKRAKLAQARGSQLLQRIEKTDLSFQSKRSRR